MAGEDEEEAQPQPQPEEEHKLHHVTIKAPPFMETAVNGWFSILEAQFNLRNITVPATRFYNALSLLPPNVAAILPADILSSLNYETLKEAVLSTYERTKPEMLDKLMSSAEMTGRPSLYLQEMMTLAKRLGVGDEIVRHKFLHALPQPISPIVAAQSSLDLSALGKMADELLPYFRNMPVNAVSTQNSLPSNKFHSGDYQKSSNRTDRRFQDKDQHDIPIGLRPYNDSQRPRICRSHIYYADRAKYCKPWCKYPNKSNCQMQPNSRPSSPAPKSRQNF